MAQLTLTQAFAHYGAKLRNPQWSVSAWAPDGSLVVSCWDHHYRRGLPGTMEFTGSLDRWSGPGNREFRRNVADAYSGGKKVRLVVVKTDDVASVESGADASKLKKEFFLREDLEGKVIELDAERYVFRFQKR
jgi:hypothetical protein